MVALLLLKLDEEIKTSKKSTNTTETSTVKPSPQKMRPIKNEKILK